MDRTFDSLVQEFFAWASATLAPATIAAYRHQLARFLAGHPRCLVSDIKPSMLTAWAKSWHQAQAVVRVLNWAAHVAQVIPKNPLGKCRLPRRGCRRRILLPREIAAYLRAARAAGRNFLLAMRETFARPQEIRLARWEELQSEDMDMRIEDALLAGKALIVFRTFKDHGRRKDSTRPRVLLVSKRLGRLIYRLRLKTRNHTGPMFRNAAGTPWTKNAVRCLMRRLGTKLRMEADYDGERVCAYTFRHSLATWAASRGITDRTLADLLGHVETRTTTRYLHLQTQHLRDAIHRASAKPRPTG